MERDGLMVGGHLGTVERTEVPVVVGVILPSMLFVLASTKAKDDYCVIPWCFKKGEKLTPVDSGAAKFPSALCL